MKKWAACLLLAACVFALGGCTQAQGEEVPAAPAAESRAGVLTGRLTEGGGADFAEVLEVELPTGETMHFTLAEDTACLKYHPYEREPTGAEKDDLQIGNWVEISCERDPNSELRTIRSIVELPAFSYEEERELYKENTPGVKSDGFQNVSESQIQNKADAVDRAKKECTIEYDTVLFSYDSHAPMWKIVFFTAGEPGADQAVYLNSEGVTCLVVYGE